jgi:hypothetical protein
LVSPRCVRQAVHAHLGSALRLFQPLSGFRFDQVPRPYFMPQPFLDCLPSEHSPRRGRAPLSRPLLLPCSCPPCPGDASPATLLPPVSPTPTFERSRLDPPRTIGSLFTRSKPRFPVTLGRRQRSHLLCQLHLLRSFDPSLSPFALTRASPGLVADALLVFRPSRGIYVPSLRASNPPEPSRTRALPGPRRNRLATLGTVAPCAG